MPSIVRARLIFSAIVCLFAAVTISAQTKPLRFPDIHGDKVAFSYGGDLWMASVSGGTAHRLTAHPGVEFFAKFSPDGKWIAFTGQYDGDEQVYVIPAEGGVPRQLTYYPATGPLPPRWGYDNQVYGWTPDGKKIIFRSLQDTEGVKDSRLYAVPVEGGLPVALPMPASGAGDMSPDGKKVVYSPLFRDFRTWKRYEGGWAQDLYIFDLATNRVENITNHVRTDRDPMWVGNKIYFVSDRDGTLNLYAYDVGNKSTAQLTRSKTWDVRWPSADADGRIVFELDGEVNLFEARGGQYKKIAISVPDDGLNTRPSRISAANLIEDYSLSYKGERALFVARGDVFTAPIEKGPTRNLTNSSNAHDKWARWSPDGKKISFISDRSGEEEIYLINQDGSGELEQLTTGGQGMRYAPEWSPDGKRLAFSDKEGKIYVLTIADKKLVEIADEKRGQVTDYAWSGDGGFLAFSLGEATGANVLHIWSVADGQTRRITDPLFNSYNPAWDPEGNYLYYLSDREFAPLIGAFEFNYAVNRQTGIFALGLRKDVKNPFAPESDEVTIAADKPKDKDKEAAKEPGKEKEADKEKAAKDAKPEEAKKEYMTVDFDGLAGRVTRVPVDSDNLGGLAAVKGHLTYVRGGAFYYGRQSDTRPNLMLFAMKDRKSSSVAEGINGYALSGDGTKTLVRQGRDFKLYDVPPKGPQAVKTVSTAGLMVDRVPSEEWAQIFDEVWRRYRDFFYVKNMHGNDWKAIGNQYRSLLKQVAHRSDLNYVISEMIAELSVSHAYIAGGDFQIPARPRVALPGARFELDAASNRYRIKHIFQGQNEEEIYRAPLTEIGVDAKVGDYVLAIDGEELRGNDNPYRLLRNKADNPVTLTLNDKPSTEGARKVAFNPVTSEANLIYLDWVSKNREKVDRMTGGRVGYMHIPDMGAAGIREFIKHYYGQVRKEGLIVDVRGNGGGNVSQMLIERLRRTLLGTGYSRTSDDPGTYPGTVFHGSMVCLLNETSASDGDIFPYMFRKAGMGPLIGKRSWGGVVGITNRGTLIDGGQVNVPEFGLGNTEGQWDIEGHGVDPDIVVENDPKSLIEGRDPQLERGVEEVLKAMKANPKKLPARPADPVKTKPRQ